MSTTRPTIDFRTIWLLVLCILPLCLAVPALHASSGLRLAGGIHTTTRDVIFPKPTPPDEGTTGTEPRA